MLLTHEHEQLRTTVNRWIQETINPHAEEWERSERFPAHEVFREAAALGLLGLTKPEENGGSNLDYSYAAVLAECLSALNCGGVGMAIGVQTDMCTPALAKHGSSDLRQRFLAPAIAGEMVGCVAVSEAGSGSDLASIRTAARKSGGDYIVSGEKTWITNGAQADFCCLLVNTSDGLPHSNKSLLVVPMKSKGLSIGSPIKKMGMRASDTVQLHFDDVRVSQENRIGDEGKGFIYQMEQFQYERLWAALKACATARRAVQETIGYTRERKAFGRSILDNQWVHFSLAELQAEIEAVHALCWLGIEKLVSTGDAAYFATTAKFKAGRLLRKVADGCLQFWGGMGFADETIISRIYRDGRLASIAGGADEVMLQVICKVLGILPTKKEKI